MSFRSALGREAGNNLIASVHAELTQTGQKFLELHNRVSFLVSLFDGEASQNRIPKHAALFSLLTRR